MKSARAISRLRDWGRSDRNGDEPHVLMHVNWLVRPAFVRGTVVAFKLDEVVRSGINMSIVQNLRRRELVGGRLLRLVVDGVIKGRHRVFLDTAIARGVIKPRS